MLDIIYIINDLELPAEVFNRLEALLPQSFHGSFLRYRRWQDRQAALFGKLLLRQLLIRNKYSLSLLASYKLDKYGRPAIDFSGDFNISHTEGAVIVALTNMNRVGIDVELIKKIDPKEFSMVFTTEEAERIGTGAGCVPRFFEVWTKKEAAMKADGRGFHLDASKINTLDQFVQIDQMKWRVAPLEVPGGYSCHYCLSEIKEHPRLFAISTEDFF